MKKILLIRHAESTSNAGERTDSHDTIPLSEKGRMQAEELAHNLDVIPELIVVSQYSRTRETAEPFIRKHPNVPIETWGVHEFTYLHPDRFSGTTAFERAPLAMKYWNNQDVHSGDGESFYRFTRRIENLLEQLRTRPEKTIAVFSHGRFILGMKMYLEKKKKLSRTGELTEAEILELMEEHSEGFRTAQPFPIGNASVHEIEL